MWWLCRLQRYNLNQYIVLESWYNNAAEDLDTFQLPNRQEQDHPGLQHLYAMQEWANICAARRLWKGEGGLQEGRRGSMLKQAACRSPRRSTLGSCTPEVWDTSSCVLLVLSYALQRSEENFQRLSSSAFPQYILSHHLEMCFLQGFVCVL